MLRVSVTDDLVEVTLSARAAFSKRSGPSSLQRPCPGWSAPDSARSPAESSQRFLIP